MGQAVSKQELTRVFEHFLEEYVDTSFEPDPEEAQAKYPRRCDDINEAQERDRASNFLSVPCPCGKNCQSQFSVDEVLDARHDYRGLSRDEKNCFMLSQLRSFRKISEAAISGRSSKDRERQKFDYRINADRAVCREVFLFYHGETIKRLKSLQKHLIEVGTSPPLHGNTGRKPGHACSECDKEMVQAFVVNFAAAHGMPDPGRDLRKGKDRLRILLPTVLNYRSVHRTYQKSMQLNDQKSVGYLTFIRIWQEVAPYICFSRPRSDLCMTCEDFKKSLHQITSDLRDGRELEKVVVLQQAIAHLRHAKKERDHYRKCIKLAEKDYRALAPRQRQIPCRANTRSITMHDSWDFAQQLHYPYEEQQVGPIYFKTPRRAQLFGVCCEGIPRQVNYLIDEADFLDKSANTVISLLDHFFAHYGMGEKHVYLTADNCVGQNKNNAVLHYLLYRVLVGLHTRIDLSFMVVGHTKFAPDGYFGLLKYRYRRSSVYTYENLANMIEASSENGHNICQRFRSPSGKPEIDYRDWSNWLSNYFKKLPNITDYHHFQIDSSQPGEVVVKESLDAPEERYMLLKGEFPYQTTPLPQPPGKLKPQGLTLDREWYLYEKIREHIPRLEDQDETCPLPKTAKPARTSSKRL